MVLDDVGGSEGEGEFASFVIVNPRGPGQLSVQILYALNFLESGALQRIPAHCDRAGEAGET
jgi:hypothetical protein